MNAKACIVNSRPSLRRRLCLVLSVILLTVVGAGSAWGQTRPSSSSRSWPPRPPEPPEERQEQENNDDSSYAVASEPIEKLREAIDAVFELRIRSGAENTERRSLAFFVSNDGLAVTAFHQLKGADSALAILPHLSEPAPVSLLSVAPRMDLALIRVTPGALPILNKRHWITVPDKPIEVDSELWLIGRSSEGEPTVAYGSCTRIIRHYAFKDETRRALPFDNLSRWAVVTCAVTLEQSGGPLINAEGELAGIGIWFWKNNESSQRRYDPRRRSSSAPTEKGLALAADHVRQLIDNAETHPTNFTQAKAKYSHTSPACHRLPRLRMTGPVNWNDLRRAANDFQKASVCPLCKGTGNIELDPEDQPKEEDTRTGAATTRPTRNYPTRAATATANASTTEDDEKRTKPCPRCEETGLANAETMVKLGSNIVRALCQCDLNLPEAQRNLVYMRSQLQDVLQINPQRMAMPLNTEARKHIHLRSLQPGQPVLFLGAVDEEQAFEDQPIRMLTVSLGDSLSRVVIAEPDMADDNLDEVVLVGGVLAGYLTSEKGRPVPVINRGFIIRMPPAEDQNDVFEDEQNGSGSNSSSSRSQRSAQERYRDWMRARYEMMRRHHGGGRQ